VIEHAGVEFPGGKAASIDDPAVEDLDRDTSILPAASVTAWHGAALERFAAHDNYVLLGRVPRVDPKAIVEAGPWGSGAATRSPSDLIGNAVRRRRRVSGAPGQVAAVTPPERRWRAAEGRAAVRAGEYVVKECVAGYSGRPILASHSPVDRSDPSLDLFVPDVSHHFGVGAAIEGRAEV
jgi:hypothetical protein